MNLFEATKPTVSSDRLIKLPSDEMYMLLNDLANQENTSVLSKSCVQFIVLALAASFSLNGEAARDQRVFDAMQLSMISFIVMLAVSKGLYAGLYSKIHALTRSCVELLNAPHQGGSVSQDGPASGDVLQAVQQDFLDCKSVFFSVVIQQIFLLAFLNVIQHYNHDEQQDVSLWCIYVTSLVSLSATPILNFNRYINNLESYTSVVSRFFSMPCYTQSNSQDGQDHIKDSSIGRGYLPEDGYASDDAYFPIN